MIRKHLGTRSTSSDIDYSEAAATTEGYSGADIGKFVFNNIIFRTVSCKYLQFRACLSRSLHDAYPTNDE